MILRFFFLFLIACTSQVKKEMTTPSEVIKKAKTLKSSDYNLEVNYSLIEEDCQITWNVQRKIENINRNIFLRLRENNCKMSFEELRPNHEMILKELFKDFSADTIGSLGTPSLSSIQRDRSWNKIMSNASLKSPEWQDYRKNYPNHSSKLSVNAIFVNLLKKEIPYSPFQKMLENLGLKVDVMSVEKVFNDKDPMSKTTVINDAGIIWWEVMIEGKN